MKRYDSYKDSGIEWIGSIPIHWEVKSVKYNFTFRTGFTPPTGKEEYYQDGTHIWINISDLNGKIIFDSANKITDKAISDFKPMIVPKGSLLYSFKLSVGKVAFTGNDCYTNEALFSIAPDGNSNLNFFYFSLPEQIIKNANENIYGAKILNQELIKNAKLIVPPAKEQAAIATFLDCKTAEIDKLIAEKKRLIELYEEERTAIINKAVTKGLDPDVKIKDSKIEWLGEIPEHWEIKRLKYVATVQTGQTPKIQNSEIDFFDNGDINWFTPSDFVDNGELMDSNRKVNSFAKESNEIDIFEEFSIFLISIGATLGKAGYCKSKASANQQINIITFRELNYEPMYGYYYIISNREMIKVEADYTTLPILNQTKSKNLWILCPSLKEQRTIAKYIETECTRIDAKIEKTKKLIDLLSEYRTTLISEVVTGKIKVTD